MAKRFNLYCKRGFIYTQNIKKGGINSHLQKNAFPVDRLKGIPSAVEWRKCSEECKIFKKLPFIQ
jgi:hypothetical protein